jgi:hypothetical protein
VGTIKKRAVKMATDSLYIEYSYLSGLSLMTREGSAGRTPDVSAAVAPETFGKVR